MPCAPKRPPCCAPRAKLWARTSACRGRRRGCGPRRHPPWPSPGPGSSPAVDSVGRHGHRGHGGRGQWMVAKSIAITDGWIKWCRISQPPTYSLMVDLNRKARKWWEMIRMKCGREVSPSKAPYRVPSTWLLLQSQALPSETWQTLDFCIDKIWNSPWPAIAGLILGSPRFLILELEGEVTAWIERSGNDQRLMSISWPSNPIPFY